jgi:hypothetical protein
VTGPPSFGGPIRYQRPPGPPTRSGRVDALVVASAFVAFAANVAGYLVGIPVWAVWLLAFVLGLTLNSALRALGRWP